MQHQNHNISKVEEDVQLLIRTISIKQITNAGQLFFHTDKLTNMKKHYSSMQTTDLLSSYIPLIKEFRNDSLTDVH